MPWIQFRIMFPIHHGWTSTTRKQRVLGVLYECIRRRHHPPPSLLKLARLRQPLRAYTNHRLPTKKVCFFHNLYISPINISQVSYYTTTPTPAPTTTTAASTDTNTAASTLLTTTNWTNKSSTKNAQETSSLTSLGSQVCFLKYYMLLTTSLGTNILSTTTMGRYCRRLLRGPPSF